jgi:phosphatidylserine/phosphatidylglycerophosphate/cardiolipin synthase-like enzyme
LAALVAAKQRGVDVVVILDKSDERASSGSGAAYVARAGIPIFIDYQPAIAHNKVIVVDKHIVVTGSYNFTAAAERKNTENVNHRRSGSRKSLPFKLGITARCLQTFC